MAQQCLSYATAVRDSGELRPLPLHRASHLPFTAIAESEPEVCPANMMIVKETCALNTGAMAASNCKKVRDRCGYHGAGARRSSARRTPVERHGARFRGACATSATVPVTPCIMSGVQLQA